jgi:hypothetical protein
MDAIVCAYTYLGRVSRSFKKALSGFSITSRRGYGAAAKDKERGGCQKPLTI